MAWHSIYRNLDLFASELKSRIVFFSSIHSGFMLELQIPNRSMRTRQDYRQLCIPHYFVNLPLHIDLHSSGIISFPARGFPLQRRSEATRPASLPEAKTLMRPSTSSGTRLPDRPASWPKTFFVITFNP